MIPTIGRHGERSRMVVAGFRQRQRVCDKNGTPSQGGETRVVRRRKEEAECAERQARAEYQMALERRIGS